MSQFSLSVVTPIDAARFDHFLNVLPPVDWQGLGGFAESFKMGEFLHGDITTVLCRIGSQHFHMTAHYRVPHRVIVEHCRSFLEAKAPSADAEPSRSPARDAQLVAALAYCADSGFLAVQSDDSELDKDQKAQALRVLAKMEG